MLVEQIRRKKRESIITDCIGNVAILWQMFRCTKNISKITCDDTSSSPKKCKDEYFKIKSRTVMINFISLCVSYNVLLFAHRYHHDPFGSRWSWSSPRLRESIWCHSIHKSILWTRHMHTVEWVIEAIVWCCIG